MNIEIDLCDEEFDIDDVNIGSDNSDCFYLKFGGLTIFVNESQFDSLMAEIQEWIPKGNNK